MNPIIWYSLLSTILVSLASFVGIFTLLIRRNFLDRIVFLLISLSAGALLGDVFFHLLPGLIEDSGEMTVLSSTMILAGIVLFFILEKFVIWHHYHSIETPQEHAEHEHSYSSSIGVMNIVGDAFHNFLDGVIIVAGFMISPVVGVSTTMAVFLHEIPQELGDFGVLIHSGFSVRKALFYNFLTALTALLGAVVTLYFGVTDKTFLGSLVPLTIGGFIYIAGSDLIPELKKQKVMKNSIFQLIALLVGIGLMYALLSLE